MITSQRRVLRARFDTADDLLRKYWGFLACGGLHLEHDGQGGHFSVGEPVLTALDLGWCAKQMEIPAVVVRPVYAAPSNGMITIQFEPGIASRMLVDEALSAACDAMPRLAPRQRARPDMYCMCTSMKGQCVHCEIVDISGHGAHLRFSESRAGVFEVGAPIRIDELGLKLTARVRWANGGHIGVEFDRMAGSVAPLVKRFVSIVA